MTLPTLMAPDTAYVADPVLSFTFTRDG